MKTLYRVLRAVWSVVLSVAAGGVVGTGLVVFALVACGCDLVPAKSASNGLGLGLKAAAPVLIEECIASLEAVNASTPPREARAVVAGADFSWCPDAIAAYDTARNVQRVMVATIGRIEAGRCAGSSSSADLCDVDRRTFEALDATADLACVMARLAEPKKTHELCKLVEVTK